MSGLVEETTYLNFSSGEATVQIAALDICKEVPIGRPVNISDLIKKAEDPEGRITKYLGEHKLPFAGNDSFYHFHLTIPTPAGLKKQDLFFSTEDKDLKYILTVAEKPEPRPHPHPHPEPKPSNNTNDTLEAEEDEQN